MERVAVILYDKDAQTLARIILRPRSILAHLANPAKPYNRILRRVHRISVGAHVILSEAKNLGFIAALYTEMFRFAQHDSGIFGIIQMVCLKRMLQLEKRPEPVQEVG